jgi:hypothetical protein
LIFAESISELRFEASRDDDANPLRSLGTHELAIEPPVAIAAGNENGDSATQEYVRVMTRKAGLTLTAARFAHLSTLAPFALAAASGLTMCRDDPGAALKDSAESRK